MAFADGGAESDSPNLALSTRYMDPTEPLCDLFGSDDCGVHSLP